MQVTQLNPYSDVSYMDQTVSWCKLFLAVHCRCKKHFQRVKWNLPFTLAEAISAHMMFRMLPPNLSK
jgi:hypothetical protein